MNKFFLVTLMIVLSVALAACQSSATPQVTVTFTPTPTETPIPTPTLHPEFIELQNIIAQTERFTLALVEDGILYDGSPIAGLEVGRDGTILLDVGDDQVVIEQSQIHFDDKEGVTIDGYDLDEDGGWVEAMPEKVLKEITVCEDPGWSDLFDGKGFLAPEHQVQVGDLGDIANWVQSQLSPDLFDPAKIKTFKQTGMGTSNGADGEVWLFPSIFNEKPPHFNHNDAPLDKNNPYCAWAEIEGEKYLVTFVPQYIEGLAPGEKPPVMVGINNYEFRADLRGAWPNVTHYYLDEMKIVPWDIGEASIEGATHFINPATGKNFTKSEVGTIVAEMRKGDFSHTHGLVLKFQVGRSDKHWFE